jgi:hypothetical protein
MKQPTRIILVNALVALLVIVLAWKFFQPAQKSPAASAQPPATVAAPKLAPAMPAASTATSAPPDRAAVSAAGGSIEPVAVTYVDKQVNLDFGQVVLTPGVPVPLHLPANQPATITATLSPDGRMQIDVDIQHAAADGPGMMLHGVFFGDVQGSGPFNLHNDDLSLSFSAKLAGH